MGVEAVRDVELRNRFIAFSLVRIVGFTIMPHAKHIIIDKSLCTLQKSLRPLRELFYAQLSKIFLSTHSFEHNVFLLSSRVVTGDVFSKKKSLMLGFYIVLPFLFFALYRLFVVLYNYFKRPFLPAGVSTQETFVSVLIYAQNAEKGIGNLLLGLSKQTHSDFEVLIFNDQSTDKTVDVISQFAAGDKRFRLFNGNDINNGWNRKCYAFEKLSQIAKGQYIVFIDSSLIVDVQLVANAIANMQHKSLSLLTVYPKPYAQGFWNRLQISTISWVWFSQTSIVKYLNQRDGEGVITDNPMIVAEASSYKTNKWFEKFKDDKNPEVEISKQKSGEILLGDDSLTFDVIEAYSSTSQYLEHFTEKFFKNRNSLIVYSIAIGLGLILAIFLLPFPLVFLYLLALIYSQMLIAMLIQQSIILRLMTMPIQYFVLVKGLIKAIKKSGKSAL